MLYLRELSHINVTFNFSITFHPKAHDPSLLPCSSSLITPLQWQIRNTNTSKTSRPSPPFLNPRTLSSALTVEVSTSTPFPLAPPSLSYHSSPLFFTNLYNSRATRFSTKYDFAKPNDRRALDLMNAAATAVMKDLPDIGLAYGVSDEFR